LIALGNVLRPGEQLDGGFPQNRLFVRRGSTKPSFAFSHAGQPKQTFQACPEQNVKRPGGKFLGGSKSAPWAGERRRVPRRRADSLRQTHPRPGAGGSVSVAVNLMMPWQDLAMSVMFILPPGRLRASLREYHLSLHGFRCCRHNAHRCGFSLTSNLHLLAAGFDTLEFETLRQMQGHRVRISADHRAPTG
jgi:hypothetical protein